MQILTFNFKDGGSCFKVRCCIRDAWICVQRFFRDGPTSLAGQGREIVQLVTIGDGYQDDGHLTLQAGVHSLL